MSKTVEQIRKRIKQLMVERGIKLKELSEKTGIKYGYLAHLLSGKNRLRIDHITQIAEALGVEPWELLAPEGVNISVSGVGVAVGVGNNVKGPMRIENVQIESKTEEGRRWERLFKDCQEKLKSCIEKRKSLEEEVERLKEDNARLRGQIEILERLLKEKEETIRVLLSRKS